ncbi:hypothetical protein K7X08_030984 [Anisodus acutangulus]|uniref:Uncharacterized protein n=1 Tax=Anisodus acutangulus TaxID=402998 RepID=A0A9Q1MUJ0_9SOLA|nr:hypothetical protein K7X08_030984 [Anisodus acutangulus]
MVLLLGLNLDDMLEEQACLVSRDCQRKVEVALSLANSSASPDEQTGNKRHAGDNYDMGSLTHAIGRDNSISCLIRCSSHRRRMHLPTMNPGECFVFSYKESLAVGTELLVFGKEILSPVIYHYSLLTNTWSSGMQMNAPRCLFGSASLGEIAILGGGCDSRGNILSSAELYNSEAGTWKSLPSMNKPRKMCSRVFMDGKFYVIGGIGGAESKRLTCGEEYDLKTRTWTEIPNMSPNADRNDMRATSGAPPLVAVVNNVLYAADYADMEVRKYDKQNKAWVTIGQLPGRASSMNGWGLAFRACGDRLPVIGGPMAVGIEYIEVNSWVPSEGALQWNLLGQKRSGSFVFNCAVMGC